ncbi:hypothetical protein NW752_009462 [Fusarium irregulare]|nr:hypothetical protein NW752_009462 [Fusarium irregulare]
MSSEILLVPTSTTEEIYQSETATSLLSTHSSILETSTDSTRLPNTAKSSATETGTTTATSETTTVSISDTVTSAETGTTAAAPSDESTAITTTAISETTAWFISETIATTESEGTTLATTETTDEPTTASMSQTTTEEIPASTTESTLPPVSTFELVARSESVGDVVMHTNGRQVLVSTGPFSSSWSSSITYDEGTGYLVVNGVPLCIMYDHQAAWHLWGAVQMALVGSIVI